MSNDEAPTTAAPGQADIQVIIGPEAQLSPQVRQALDELARALEGTQGAMQPSIKCDSVGIRECVTYMVCTGVTS